MAIPNKTHGCNNYFIDLFNFVEDYSNVIIAPINYHGDYQSRLMHNDNHLLCYRKDGDPEYVDKNWTVLGDGVVNDFGAISIDGHADDYTDSREPELYIWFAHHLALMGDCKVLLRLSTGYHHGMAYQCFETVEIEYTKDGPTRWRLWENDVLDLSYSEELCGYPVYPHFTPWLHPLNGSIIDDQHPGPFDIAELWNAYISAKLYERELLWGEINP